MAKLKWRKPRTPACRKTKVVLVGGPWDGGSLYLADPLSGTLTFTASGRTGRYRGLSTSGKGRTERSTLTWEKL